MKTWRAFVWGSALGALVGLILAPRRDAIERARLADERDRPAGAATSTGAELNRAAAEEAQARSTAPAAYQSGTAGRRYVGNLNTRIYHEATEANLPNEEHRAYFGTPEEAEAAGYRPAH